MVARKGDNLRGWDNAGTAFGGLEIS